MYGGAELATRIYIKHSNWLLALQQHVGAQIERHRRPFARQLVGSHRFVSGGANCDHVRVVMLAGLALADRQFVIGERI